MSNQDHMHADRKHTSFLPVLTNYLQHLKAFVAKLAFFFWPRIFWIPKTQFLQIGLHSWPFTLKIWNFEAKQPDASTIKLLELFQNIRLFKRVRVQFLIQTIVSKSKTFILRHIFSFVNVNFFSCVLLFIHQRFVSTKIVLSQMSGS